MTEQTDKANEREQAAVRPDEEQSETQGEEQLEEQSETLDETEKALKEYIDDICASGKRPRIKYKRTHISVNGRRFYYDDDGRTVAPMANAGGILYRGERKAADPEKLEKARRTLRGFDSKSARAFTCGSTMAALLVAAVFIGGIGLLIWLLTAVW